MKMSYLIDTDIIVYSLKNQKQVISNFEAKINSPKSISVISYGELIYGANKSKHREKNIANVHRLSEIFPLLPITPSIMETFGELKARLSIEGSIIADMDLLIASTAITHNLILVTNNERHFGRITELELENWTSLNSH
jgi:tRNA(fMet)-specific endonuclease VapC